MSNAATFPQIQNALRSFQNYLSGESDPIVSLVQASLGSIYVRTSGTVAIYQKTGVNPGEWTLLNQSSLATGRIHWLVEGGAYPDLQDAHDAANPNDVIMIGPGVWGDCVITKNISFYGLTGFGTIANRIGKIEYNVVGPGASVYITNLTILAPENDYAIEGNGTDQGVFVMTNVEVTKGIGNDLPLVVMNNTSLVFVHFAGSIGTGINSLRAMVELSNSFTIMEGITLQGLGTTRPLVEMVGGNSRLNFLNGQTQGEHSDTFILTGANSSILLLNNQLINQSLTGNMFNVGLGCQAIVVYNGILVGGGYVARGTGNFIHLGNGLLSGDTIQNTLTIQQINTTLNPVP